MSSYGTKFRETEALLAVQAGNEEAAEEHLAEMSARELRDLADAAERLHEMAYARSRSSQSPSPVRISEHPSGALVFDVDEEA